MWLCDASHRYILMMINRWEHISPCVDLFLLLGCYRETCNCVCFHCASWVRWWWNRLKRFGLREKKQTENSKFRFVYWRISDLLCDIYDLDLEAYSAKWIANSRCFQLKFIWKDEKSSNFFHFFSILKMPIENKRVKKCWAIWIHSSHNGNEPAWLPTCRQTACVP